MDVVVARDGADRREFAGGCALNVAVGLSRLRQPASLATALGADAHGHFLAAFLARERVRLTSHGARASTVAIDSTYVGDEAVYRWRDEVALYDFALDAIDERVVADAAAMVFSAACLTATGDVGPVTRLAARTSGLTVLDPNPRPALMLSPAAARQRLEAVASRFRVVKLSHADIVLLYGEAASEAAARLLRLGVGAVIVTLGDRGAEAHTEHGVVVESVRPYRGPVAHTMGAGDAFTAATVDHLLTFGWPASLDAWASVLKAGAAAGALACGADGAADSMPTRSQLADLLSATE